MVSAVATQGDVSVRFTAKGTVSALQTVEVRPQLSATIKAVHIKEGQFVHKGDRLFTLDTRTETANLGKAEAQLIKDRADLATAERNLERQRELFRQNSFHRRLSIRHRTRLMACAGSLRSIRQQQKQAAWRTVSARLKQILQELNLEEMRSRFAY